jgi:hypothetical protein
VNKNVPSIMAHDRKTAKYQNVHRWDISTQIVVQSQKVSSAQIPRELKILHALAYVYTSIRTYMLYMLYVCILYTYTPRVINAITSFSSSALHILQPFLVCRWEHMTEFWTIPVLVVNASYFCSAPHPCSSSHTCIFYPNHHEHKELIQEEWTIW